MQQFILGTRLEAAVGADATKMVNGVIIAHLPVWDYDKYEGYYVYVAISFLCSSSRRYCSCSTVFITR